MRTNYREDAIEQAEDDLEKALNTLVFLQDNPDTYEGLSRGATTLVFEAFTNALIELQSTDAEILLS